MDTDHIGEKARSYWLLHVPTETTVKRTVWTTSRLVFLELLNEWNASKPGVWVHWESRGENGVSWRDM